MREFLGIPTSIYRLTLIETNGPTDLISEAIMDVEQTGIATIVTDDGISSLTKQLGAKISGAELWNTHEHFYSLGPKINSEIDVYAGCSPKSSS